MTIVAFCCSIRKIKMKLLVAFAGVILAVSALTEKIQWEAFKVKHGKSYGNPIEESRRYSIFLSNLEKIRAHNARYEAGEETYSMAVNKFADMTEQEFKERLRVQRKNMPKMQMERHIFQEGFTVPNAIDWREEGAVLEVKDQGSCGSCWAFSSTGALEGQNYILNKVSLTLSEQELLDCSEKYGNGDCYEGGLMTSAFEYVQDNGIESEDDYPYEADQNECRASASKKVLNIQGYKVIDPTEEALKNAVGSIGPISVAIYAEPIQFYNKGIFNNENCFNNLLYLDHGVLAVGYGTENDQPFWIVKNSWGADWGEQGYFRIARGANLCGIALMASYPVL